MQKVSCASFLWSFERKKINNNLGGRVALSYLAKDLPDKTSLVGFADFYPHAQKTKFNVQKIAREKEIGWTWNVSSQDSEFGPILSAGSPRTVAKFPGKRRSILQTWKLQASCQSWSKCKGWRTPLHTTEKPLWKYPCVKFIYRFGNDSCKSQWKADYFAWSFLLLWFHKESEFDATNLKQPLCWVLCAESWNPASLRFLLPNENSA